MNYIFDSFWDDHAKSQALEACRAARKKLGIKVIAASDGMMFGPEG